MYKRQALAFLCEAYEEQELEGGDTRVVMHFHPALAPYKCAVLPLQKNKCGEKAGEIYDMLSKHFMVDYDETGSIGKRYRRQDEIGTPMCITVDFDTLETGVVLSLLHISQEKHVFVMEAFWTKFIPLYRQIEEILESGKLGEIRAVTAQYGYTCLLYTSGTGRKHNDGESI